LAFKFEASGQADFTFPSMPGVGLECTSTHSVEKQSSDQRKKIRRAIAAKAKKAYASSGTALVIDITNISSMSYRHLGLALGEEETREVVATNLAATKFGATVLLTVLVNNDRDPPWIETRYNRFDNEVASRELLELMEVLFPDGPNEGIDNFSIPSRT
jgi:hypothetical protein